MFDTPKGRECQSLLFQKSVSSKDFPLKRRDFRMTLVPKFGPPDRHKYQSFGIQKGISDKVWYLKKAEVTKLDTPKERVRIKV